MVGRFGFIWLVVIAIVAVSCSSNTQPKPRGYFRIELPVAEYTDLKSAGDAELTANLPYTFEMNNAAIVREHPDGEQYWIDIVYPCFDVQVHCSYKPIENNLRELSDDAQRFVYNHAGKASAIPEQGYEDDEARMYGVMYELMGNTASPCQFYLTDSTHHFFRGAVYFNCIPQQDSLAPVRDYIIDDIRHLIETMRWSK